MIPLLLAAPPGQVPATIQSLGGLFLGLAALATAVAAFRGRTKASRAADPADDAKARQDFLDSVVRRSTEIEEQARLDRAEHARAMVELRDEHAQQMNEIRALLVRAERRYLVLIGYTETVRAGYHPAPPPPYPEDL